MDDSSEVLIGRFIHASEAVAEQMKMIPELASLTPRQERCIEVIAEENNPTLSEISNLLGISKPSVSALLEKLERRVYLRRVRSDQDRRTAHVHLTPKGEVAANLHRDQHRRISELLMENLTQKERDQFLFLFAKALEPLETSAKSSKKRRTGDE